MNITTWNVNSLNVRLPQVLDFLSQQVPDVLALQETKTPDAQFPHQPLLDAGYQVIFRGQKAYNGVAILAKTTMTDVVDDLPDLNDPQRRLLAVTVDDVRIINVYIPNGQALDSDKYRYKCRWLEAFAHWLREQQQRYPRLVVLGDFNIAPQAIDMHDAARWQGKIMCSTHEQQWFQQRLNEGLSDAVRELAENTSIFTWWDYRMQAYRRGWGLRIDHILTSSPLQPTAYHIGTLWREHERPSDHVPVTLSLNTHP